MEGPRACRPDELPSLLRMINLVFRPNGGPDMGREYPVLFSRANCPDLTIISEGGVPVAHIGVLRQSLLLDGAELVAGCVGSVGTHPEHRQRGHAGTILDHCIERFRREGCDIFIVSGDRSLYRRAGCARAAAALYYEITPDAALLLTEGMYHVAPYRDEDFDPVAAIYHSEPVRYRRPYERFKASLDGFLAAQVKLFCVRDEADRLVAYAATRGQNLLEWAGTRRAVAASLHSIVTALGTDELDICLPEYDAELRGIFESRRIQGGPCTHSGTIRILSLASIGRRIAPRIEERFAHDGAVGLKLDDAADGFEITAGGERAIITDRLAMARIVFGRHSEWGIELPGGIRAALQKLFPLPLPPVGFSYI